MGRTVPTDAGMIKWFARAHSGPPQPQSASSARLQQRSNVSKRRRAPSACSWAARDGFFALSPERGGRQSWGMEREASRGPEPNETAPRVPSLQTCQRAMTPSLISGSGRKGRRACLALR